jgi:membrane-bound lytic murein transglycosylase D
MIKRIFREMDIPEELVYLALIESGYNPKAYSRAKASGMWQFITKTGKRFGLKVNKWVDERRDPEKSTYAAAAYLKSLYEMFNSWDLALAGYNAGEGKILKAMRKAKTQDFWEISRHAYLKKETKEYVPMFLAAVTIAQDPRKYGFQEVESEGPFNYDKVKVPASTHLETIANAAETDLSELRALNPALRREKTPPDSALFEINLPPGKKEIFEKNFRTQAASKNGKKHRVRPGENLSRIAKKYRVSMENLCALNGLSDNAAVRPGFVLLLPSL